MHWRVVDCGKSELGRSWLSVPVLAQAKRGPPQGTDLSQSHTRLRSSSSTPHGIDGAHDDHANSDDGNDDDDGADGVLSRPNSKLTRSAPIAAGRGSATPLRRPRKPYRARQPSRLPAVSNDISCAISVPGSPIFVVAMVTQCALRDLRHWVHVRVAQVL